MKNRCLNPNNDDFERYSALGICDHWIGRHSFPTFFADMGERPAGKTLDRIDNEKGYLCPRCGNNCRWATAKEQIANQRPPRPRRPSSRQSCCKAGKSANIHASSGVIRGIPG
jgi:hypothetical protein